MTDDDHDIDWSLTTWDGSRRAQLRLALAMTVRERLQACDALDDLGQRLAEIGVRARRGTTPSGEQ